MATKSRLPRLCSGRTRRAWAIFEVDQVLRELIDVEAARSSSGTPNAREANTASCVARDPLAGEDVLDERDAGLLRLRLQRLGLELGHEPVLRERAREAADVACGGVRGHGLGGSNRA